MQLLFVGNVEHPEFQAVGRVWSGRVGIAALPNLAAASTHLRDWSDNIDLVVLAQVRPGTTSVTELIDFQHEHPLIPIVGLEGSWFDGAERSRQTLPGIIGVSGSDWDAFFETQLERIRDNAPPLWALPATSFEVERLLGRHVRPTGGTRVTIASDHLEFRHTLERLFTCRGWKVSVWQQEPSCDAEVVLGVWDGDRELRTMHDARPTPDRANALGAERVPGWFCGDELVLAEIWKDFENFVTALSPIPVLVVCSFPRLDDIECFRKRGARSVISKPFFVDELLTAALSGALGPEHLIRDLM